MLRHEIKSKVLTISNHKEQAVYYAYPKLQQKQTNVVCDTLQLGMSMNWRN